MTVEAAPPSRVPDELAVTGPNGADRVRISTGELPAMVDVLDVNGQLRARLCTAISPNGATPIGSAGLNVYSANGALTARIGTYSPPEGGVAVLLRDQQERNRIRLLVEVDGTPHIEILDENGTVIWHAP
jgi:hypothetical protein